MHYARQEYATLSQLQEEVAKCRVYATGREERNRPKNRYSNNTPDEAYLLKAESYINASLLTICGDTGIPIRVVCTQAPLPETIADFWCMVWEQNCPVVCCLTELESEEEKYWPKRGEMKVVKEGRLEVVLKSKLRSVDGIVIRRIVLRDVMTNISKNVVHLAYGGWPDGLNPSSSVSLRRLLRMFIYFWEQCEDNLNCPPVVHCLAGINRAPSFIALLVLFQSATFKNLLYSPDFRGFVDGLKVWIQNENDHMMIPSHLVYLHHTVEEVIMKRITIMNLIHELRLQRNIGVIQTIDQYLFIYQILKDELIEPTSTKDILSEIENSKPSTQIIQSEKLTLNCDNFDLESDYILQFYSRTPLIQM
jgi:protein tyrosine phosphatase